MGSMTLLDTLGRYAPQFCRVMQRYSTLWLIREGMEGEMQGPQCSGVQFTRAGRDRQQRQLYQCRACEPRITSRSGSASRGYRFPDDIIALAVRWYLRYRLSYADVAEWLAKRGISVDPSTIYDWVQTFTPRFITAARAYRTAVSCLLYTSDAADE